LVKDVYLENLHQNDYTQVACNIFFATCWWIHISLPSLPKHGSFVIAFTFKTRNIVHLPTEQHQCTSQDCFWTNFISPHAYLLYILNVHAAKFLDYRNNLFKDVHFVDLQSKWIYIVACNILSIQPCTSPFTIVIQVSLPVEWLSMNSLSSLLLHFQSVLPS